LRFAQRSDLQFRVLSVNAWHDFNTQIVYEVLRSWQKMTLQQKRIGEAKSGGRISCALSDRRKVQIAALQPSKELIFAPPITAPERPPSMGLLEFSRHGLAASVLAS
jgi:hypothetical protein